MPQNAHIVASGGDYTTIIAWEAAEQGSDYSGSITVGRVDGFFDQGSTSLSISGTWVNGARLEPFDSADAFNGTERKLCGLTVSTGTRAILFNTSTDIEIEGLEMFKTAGGTSRVLDEISTGTRDVFKCLISTSVSRSIQNVTGVNDCVIVNTKSANPIFFGTCNIDKCSIFTDATSDIGVSATLTATNTVSVNVGTGDDWDVGVSQTNNAATDTTADTLDNIVVANEFVDSDPVSNLDYRILATGDLASNVIGAFIQSGGGISIPVIMNSYRQRRV